MAEFIPSVEVDVGCLVTVEHVQGKLVGLVAQCQFVILLPQVTLQNFGSRQEFKDGSVPAIQSAPKSRSPGNGSARQQSASWHQSGSAQTKALHKCPPAEESITVSDGCL